MRVLTVEDEPLLAEAVRNGLRQEAIAADVAGDGHAGLELLSVNSYDLAILDRDIPGPNGDEIAHRIDDKASGFELGADDYLKSGLIRYRLADLADGRLQSGRPRRMTRHPQRAQTRGLSLSGTEGCIEICTAPQP